MPVHALCESLLRLVTTPHHAHAIVGDLLEERPAALLPRTLGVCMSLLGSAVWQSWRLTLACIVAWQASGLVGGILVARYVHPTSLPVLPALTLALTLLRTLFVYRLAREREVPIAVAVLLAQILAGWFWTWLTVLRVPSAPWWMIPLSTIWSAASLTPLLALVVWRRRRDA
jgi:hypothetical protein